MLIDFIRKFMFVVRFQICLSSEEEGKWLEVFGKDRRLFEG